MQIADAVLAVAVSVTVAATGGAVWLAVQDGEKWQEFKTQHNCKVVAKVSGSVMCLHSGFLLVESLFQG
jgi:hypothetical protein